MEKFNKERLYHSLMEEGIGQAPGDYNETVDNLKKRGLAGEEAEKQYEAELLLSQQFGESSWFTYAPNMKISFGTVMR
jgi:hypothetical protein